MKPISFLINVAVDTLSHVKLLLKSLRQNLVEPDRHEILIFLDSDNEGTLEYLEAQKQNFKDLKIITHTLLPCVGYARNNNLLVEMAKNEIVSYLQSDMVVSPNYDVDILKDLKKNQILSATRIEPPLHGEGFEKIVENFGTNPEIFEIERFNDFAKSIKKDKSIEYFFAPFTFYKQTWLDLGGYDTLFRRSREDSDLLQRCIHTGVEIKQTFKANVYHFTCVTSRGKNWFDEESEEARQRVELQNMADSVELKRFIRKWGSFAHGRKLNKYSVDLQFVDTPEIGLIEVVEPYYNRLWAPQQSWYTSFITQREKDDFPANQMMNFSRSHWKKAKKFYNQIDFNKKFMTGAPDSYNALVVLDGKATNSFIDLTTKIHLVIDGYDLGEYNYDGIKIYIKNKVLDNPPNLVINPEFDMTLLSVK